MMGAAGAAYDEGLLGVIADPFGGALVMFLAGFFFVRFSDAEIRPAAPGTEQRWRRSGTQRPAWHAATVPAGRLSSRETALQTHPLRKIVQLRKIAFLHLPNPRTRQIVILELLPTF